MKCAALILTVEYEVENKEHFHYWNIYQWIVC